MRTPCIIIAIALLGCADPPPLANAEQVQRQANVLRADVNTVVDELKPLGPLIAVYCGIHGEQDKHCVTLRTGWNIADRLIDGAHELIDAYEDMGVGVSKVEDAVKAVHKAADDVKRAVTEVVSHAHVDPETDRVGGDPGERSSGPQAAPGSAEGAGQTPGTDAPAGAP